MHLSPQHDFIADAWIVKLWVDAGSFQYLYTQNSVDLNEIYITESSIGVAAIATLIF